MNPLGPTIPPLTPKQQVSLLARCLYHEGYDDHLAGHITFEQPDGTVLATPFGLTWDEVRAGDIMTMDLDGNALDGPWTVTPAILLHTEIHKVRDDATVIVHNHPRFGTTWADRQEIPPVYDQTSAMMVDDVALYKDFDGAVADPDAAALAAKGIADARTALLSNHGVVVIAEDIPKAHHRAVVLEWRSRMAWQVEALGEGGHPMDARMVQDFGGLFDYTAYPGMWEAMVRRELRRDPAVLDEEPTSYAHLF